MVIIMSNFGLIPASEKALQSKADCMFLIAITLLKQVLTLPEIKQGILFQELRLVIDEAYNLFCQNRNERFM